MVSWERSRRIAFCGCNGHRQWRTKDGSMVVGHAEASVTRKPMAASTHASTALSPLPAFSCSLLQIRSVTVPARFS
jgi:hypothetical protein